MSGLVRLECVKCGCVFETLNPPLDFIEFALCPTCQRNLGREDCEAVTEPTEEPAPTTGPRRF